ncbi:hypothetical protein PR202_ga00676 [Eleusine coracana subsp. coracana]|uniref:FAS1 domain-containing protein n=1 Tax=Eleusine coracana subsp. coracana TaxID=191504 RepID=A0AAV5BEM1_ELECO|nr:hypothetical protein QOZ80_2AG0130160 [Eleusine coracana subsp. coracana]GJM84959.1 hypothetical protein PR202_ga00676 [Eleusine coracana subsp. coracana]
MASSQHASTGGSVSLILFLLAGLASSASAFNITRLLGEFSDFSSFNDLLTRTKLAEEINRRQTITVLALDNGAAGGVSSLPSDVQRKVLAMHVVLDYYDTAKLEAIKGKSAVLTTLFQSSGQATDRMGFLNFTKRADGSMVFGSAEPGAQMAAHMVKSVASRPYNISVLQVSAAIVPPGVGGKVAAPAPAKGKKKAAPPPSDGEEEAPALGPSDDDEASADAPAADGPGPSADGPVADGPMADGPSADGPAGAGSDDAADAPEGSAAARVLAGAGLGVLAMLLLII